MLKQVVDNDEGYGEFRKFANYVTKKERYPGRLGKGSIIINIFNLLKELDIFKCD